MNKIIALVILVACSSHDPAPSAHGTKRGFATDRAMLPGYREFDLLSGPVAPGEKVEAMAHITWQYSDCRMTVADAVQSFFPGNYLYDDMQGNLTAHGTNAGKETARFAAMVSCKVPDGAEVEHGEIKWPDLVTDAGTTDAQ